MSEKYPVLFKGKKYEGHQLDSAHSNCYIIQQGTKITGRIIHKPEGWYILGFFSSPYKTKSSAARATLSYTLSTLAEHHKFVKKCDACGENHLHSNVPDF